MTRTLLAAIDGHTRLACAQTLGIGEVPVSEHAFADQWEALRYSLHKQKDRRNLTGKELVAAIMIVDKEYRQPKGGNNRYGRAGKPAGEIETSAEVSISPPADSGNHGMSTRIVADLVGTSPATVDRASRKAKDRNRNFRGSFGSCAS